jgi:hypothetical protein
MIFETGSRNIKNHHIPKERFGRLRKEIHPKTRVAIKRRRDVITRMSQKETEMG